MSARLTLLLLLLALLAAPVRADLLVGVAEADVTPAVGTPLAGYGGRMRKGGPDLDPRNDHVLFEPSTGVRDPIEAQALVLVDGETVAALLAIDAIGVEETLLAEVAAAARARGVPLEPTRIVMAASHTHSGPGAVARTRLWSLAAADLFQARVHRVLVARLGDLLAQAWAARRPARLADGRAEVKGATSNRRAGEDSGGAGKGFRSDSEGRRPRSHGGTPAAPEESRSEGSLAKPDDVDPRLGLLRIDDATGAPLAVVMHFAVHGTCLGDDNLRFSADVPGAIRRAVRERVGCPVLFLNGCEGDVAPSPGGEAGLTQVPAKVAPVAEGLWRGLTPRAGVHLTTSSVRRDLGPLVLHPGLGQGGAEGPLVKGVLGLVRTLGGGGRALALLAPRSYRFTALRLGDLVLMTVPGEPITAVAPRLEGLAHEAGAPRAWVVGLANGHFGYLTTPEEYAAGGYEAWLTFHGPEQLDRVADAVRDALVGVASVPY
jgi:neutral ceramidase